MIIDTSALIAILHAEPEANDFIEIIGAAEICHVSAVSLLEAGIVTQAEKGAGGLHDLDAFLKKSPITVEVFTEEQAFLACKAYAAYGKGNHPARLNFGDCASYALAKLYGEPLLFKGTDFSQTDVEAAYQGGYKSA